MKNIKQDLRIFNALLFFVIALCTFCFLKAPLDQTKRANPDDMKMVMEQMTREIQLLEQQHSKLPKEKDWQKALSSFVYHFDYDVYVWNEKQEGIYYANFQKQNPLLLKNALNNAILTKPTPSSSSIQKIIYNQKSESRFGYYVYIPKWKVYVSLTGTNGYFESPYSLLWKSVFMEVSILLFALGIYKEIMRKHYVKPLERIVAIIEKDYSIDLSKLSVGTGEYEAIAEQLESIREMYSKEKSGAS